MKKKKWEWRKEKRKQTWRKVKDGVSNKADCIACDRVCGLLRRESCEDAAVCVQESARARNIEVDRLAVLECSCPAQTDCDAPGCAWQHKRITAPQCQRRPSVSSRCANHLSLPRPRCGVVDCTHTVSQSTKL